MSFELMISLMSDLRAYYAGTCLRCGGPYQPGDRVVPIASTPWAASGACHRSCWFATHEELRRFKRRTVQRQSEPVDPRQASLFDQPTVITQSSQIQPDAHGLGSDGDQQESTASPQLAGAIGQHR